MRFIRNWRRGRWLRDHPIPEDLWRRTLAGVPLLGVPGREEQDRLRELATVFLREKNWLSTHELELTEEMRVHISALAVLPLLGLDLDWYQGWETVIVYPGEFVHRREEVDSGGLVHEWDEVLGGEAWERGPVIFSWADVRASGRLDGYNVVIHELAHKLDMLNGPPDGFPPLHSGMDRRRWTAAFTAAWDEFERRLDAGEETEIDPYAGESPAEFFAVLSEYFFELPAVVQRAWPEVYEQLVAFYRQDPSNWPGTQA